MPVIGDGASATVEPGAVEPIILLPAGWVVLHIVDVHSGRVRVLRARAETVSRYTNPGDAHSVPNSIKSEVYFRGPDLSEWCAETPEEIDAILGAAAVTSVTVSR